MEEIRYWLVKKQSYIYCSLYLDLSIVLSLLVVFFTFTKASKWNEILDCKKCISKKLAVRTFWLNALEGKKIESKVIPR